MSDLVGNESFDALEFEREVVGPAIPPRFTGLQAPQQDMLGVRLVVSSSMVVLRLVATPDMATRRTHPEVDPGRSDAKAILAALCVWAYLWYLVGNMRAIVGHRAMSVVWLTRST